MEQPRVRAAGTVREALLERGGGWITADVYVRTQAHAQVYREERTKRFLEKHRVEKKFADWSAAEAFFVGCGFTIARRLSPSADPWRGRETWVLSPRR